LETPRAKFPLRGQRLLDRESRRLGSDRRFNLVPVVQSRSWAKSRKREWGPIGWLSAATRSRLAIVILVTALGSWLMFCFLYMLRTIALLHFENSLRN
jgi:hypothetical protein